MNEMSSKLLVLGEQRLITKEKGTSNLIYDTVELIVRIRRIVTRSFSPNCFFNCVFFSYRESINEVTNNCMGITPSFITNKNYTYLLWIKVVKNSLRH